MERELSSMGFIPATINLQSYINIGGTGVLGLEYASGYWDMSTFQSDYLIVLVPESDINIDSSVCFRGIPTKEDLSNTIKLAENLYITDRERTICDMIEYGCGVRFLLESIQSYYEDFTDTSKLENLVKERNLMDKFMQYREEAEEMYYDEM